MTLKKTRLQFGVALLATFFILLQACKQKNEGPALTAYNLEIPSGLPDMVIPTDNPLTEEGVALGRKLFYDPILSGNNQMSCGTCHKQAFAFTDSTLSLSIGIDGHPGTRNTMSLANLGFQRKFFWDGGAADLESQVIGPIQNPLEMHQELPAMIAKLNASPEYPALFSKVFGSATITTPMVMKAIAQFERTLISANSKFDQYKRGTATLTAEESRGKDIFEAEDKGDCTHCHSLGSTFSDFEFRNTGLDSIPVDAGRAKITLLSTDSGRFKTPSLRNIALTAPYMHDGRFKTLGECIDHYNTGFHYTANLDGSLLHKVKGRLSAQDKADLIAFLNTLTDYEFIHNPKFAKP
jgi:cytochrome c peroxidase